MAGLAFSEADKQTFVSEGVFPTLDKLSQQRKYPAEFLDGFRSGFLGFHLIDRFKEADSELTKLQAALARLKQISTSIENSKKISASDPRIGQFMNDLDAVDGWTISLLETVWTIIGFLDAKKAQSKVAQLSTAMNTLTQKRQQEMYPFLKDPSLFKGYMG